MRDLYVVQLQMLGLIKVIDCIGKIRKYRCTIGFWFLNIQSPLLVLSVYAN